MPSIKAARGSGERKLAAWLECNTKAQSKNPRKGDIIQLRGELKDAITTAEMNQLRRLANPELVCVWLTLVCQQVC